MPEDNQPGDSITSEPTRFIVTPLDEEGTPITSFAIMGEHAELCVEALRAGRFDVMQRLCSWVHV